MYGYFKEKIDVDMVWIYFIVGLVLYFSNFNMIFVCDECDVMWSSVLLFLLKCLFIIFIIFFVGVFLLFCWIFLCLFLIFELFVVLFILILEGFKFLLKLELGFEMLL